MKPERLQGLMVKIESTYGTDSTPVAADDGVQLAGGFYDQLTPSRAFLNRRDNVFTGTLAPAAPATPVGRLVEIRYGLQLRGAGATYSSSVLPEADASLRACGLARTDDFAPSSESVEYARADTGHSSVTIYAEAADKLWKIVGCRGTLDLRVPPGQTGELLFRMFGFMTADITEQTLESITLDSIIPPPIRNAALTLAGSYTPKWSSGEFVLNADVQRHDSGNASDAILEYEILKFDPRLRITAQVEDVSTVDLGAILTNRTAQSVAAAFGSVQFNKMDLVVTNAYLADDPSPTIVNGKTYYNLEFELNDFILRFN